MTPPQAEHIPVVRVCFLRQAALIYRDDGSDSQEPVFEPSTATAVGIDLRACFSEMEFCLPAGNRLPIPAGVAIEPITPGIAGFVYSRSGLGAKHGLVVAQGVGVIDPDYRGEIVVWLLNTSETHKTVARGERIAQLVVMPFRQTRLEITDELGATSRGAGGFGHTGRM